MSSSAECRWDRLTVHDDQTWSSHARDRQSGWCRLWVVVRVLEHVRERTGVGRVEHRAREQPSVAPGGAVRSRRMSVFDARSAIRAGHRRAWAEERSGGGRVRRRRASAKGITATRSSLTRTRTRDCQGTNSTTADRPGSRTESTQRRCSADGTRMSHRRQAGQRPVSTSSFAHGPDPTAASTYAGPDQRNHNDDGHSGKDEARRY